MDLGGSVLAPPPLENPGYATDYKKYIFMFMWNFSLFLLIYMPSYRKVHYFYIAIEIDYFPLTMRRRLTTNK